RHALPHQATSDLALEAVQRCLDRAGVGPRDIDLCLVGTFTPDYSFPSTACILQDKLKLVCPAVDLQAACAGFMYALVTGYAYVSRRPPTPELLASGQHYMYMDGRAVFRWAVAILNDTIQDVLTAGQLRPGDVDLYVPHQANIRIINAACDTLKIPRA